MTKLSRWLRSALFGALVLAAACNSQGGCGPEEPGKPGEDCNFNAPNSDGCDETSVCLNSVCSKMCSSDRDCGGGQCLDYTKTYSGEKVSACNPPSGGSGSDTGGTTGGGGGSGGCVPQSHDCSALQNACAGGGQAPCYCAAACACANSCDPCEAQNRSAAQQLGTTCSY